MITIPGKIPVSIRPLFWLVAFFIGWMWTMSLLGALLCVGVIVLSVLFHEFGHALTACAFGQKCRIELAAFGGFTYREGGKLKLWKEFFIVLNGPIFGFLLFLGAYILSRTVPIQNELLAFAVRFTYVANFFWTIINLIPVLPLDGGHLLSIILEGIFGFKGIKAAIVIGLVISVLISIFFFATGHFLVGALFLILTFESFRSLRYYRIFKEQDRNTEMQDVLREADIDLESGNTQAALEKLEHVRGANKEGILYTLATQQIAEIYRREERYDEAYQLLLPIYKHLSGENLSTFHFLAHMNGDYKMVTEVGNKCFQENPSYNTALINALAYGALEKSEPACGWLDCALREGLPSLRDALSHPEFDAIRDNPKFKKFTAS
ncbi:MAG: M50 family metallopeptidase [Chlamydiales bacterium]|nr:M50 family metallopeptidase [Chlamydiales bacterium]